MAQPFGTHATIIAISICLVITVVITIRLLYQMCVQKPASNQRMAYTLIKVCIIASTLCVVCDDIRWSICAIMDKSEVFYPMNQIMSFADLFYYIGALSFYTIAIYRLYISFLDTIYSINPCIIRFFIVSLIIQALGATYYCIIVALQPKEDKNAFFLKYNSISSITLMSNDFILNLSLLLLFISKLKESLTDTLVSSSIQEIGSSMDTVSQNMVDLITRHSLLFGLAIITNQLFLGSQMIVFSNIGFTKFKYHFIIFICRSIENTANCVVLFLGLKPNRKLYFNICGKCHLLLAGCFMKSTQKRVESRRDTHYQKMHKETEMMSSASI